MIIRTHSRTLFAIADGILQNREEAEDARYAATDPGAKRRCNHVECADDRRGDCVSRPMGDRDCRNCLDNETCDSSSTLMFWGAHAPSRAVIGALANHREYTTLGEKSALGERFGVGAEISTRRTRAPRKRKHPCPHLKRIISYEE
jgi:hypothetical protein